MSFTYCLITFSSLLSTIGKIEPSETLRCQKSSATVYDPKVIHVRVMRSGAIEFEEALETSLRSRSRSCEKTYESISYLVRAGNEEIQITCLRVGIKKMIRSVKLTMLA